ncbi:MAG: hypothetical protein ABSG15_12555 [FCB group bacterium]|jgi:hypothetical protein
MNSLINKFKKIEREIAKERGPFYLFGIFIPQEKDDFIDVVASADWFYKSERKTLDYFFMVIKKYLNESEMTKISRVVLLKPNEEFVKYVNETFLNLGAINFNNVTINGIDFKNVCIITSKTKGDLINHPELI